ncbi:MAG TPA: hypothetical protein VJI32_05715 [Candidatus Nanoarchaeia archaeon]|nr:hypothetical protein [Candidatus Nanoarchaeia archaeon]
MSTPGHEKSHLRFYLVMVTLVVGGILFLLFMNDSEKFSLTSAIVGSHKNESGGEELLTNEEIFSADEGAIDEVFSKKIEQNANEVDLTLSFDEIPNVAKKSKIRDIELHFTNPGAKINVNNDRLELNNLDEVILKIEGFNGDISLQRLGFSVDGTAKSINVNGIALSAKTQMKVSFTDISYDYLSLEDIQLEEVEFPVGSGELKVSEKLTYSLEQDTLKIFFFNGKMVIDRDADTLLTLEGVAKGVSAGGALLNFNLR